MDRPGTHQSVAPQIHLPRRLLPRRSRRCCRRSSDVGLWVTDIEILRLHYAETLRDWRRRFRANRDQIAALYDERFCRMWEFYLVGCEIAFRHMGQMVFQMQLAKRQVDAVPLTRDYIIDWERSHAGQRHRRLRRDRRRLHLPLRIDERYPPE